MRDYKKQETKEKILFDDVFGIIAVLCVVLVLLFLPELFN
jgi:hypothetical protein